MDEAYRLSDTGDARRLVRQAQRHPEQRYGHVREVAVVGNTPGQVVADGGRFELDPAGLAAADAELGRWRDELATLLAESAQLDTPLRDGGGPVAGHLRKAFGLRGSSESGVQAALRDYLAELDALRSAIRQAGADHGRHEADVADRLRSLHTDDGER